MPYLSLIPWKLVGIIAVILGVWGYGYWGGITHEREKQLVIAAKSLEKALKDAEASYQVTMNTEKQHWLETQKIKEVTRTITKVIRDEKPSADCSLSNGWVQRHNESATNTLPKAPTVNYEANSGITANKALEGIAENYGTCHEIRQIAVDCQSWITEQQKLMGKVSDN